MQETKKAFNHYKLHTQYSICEGAIKIEDLEKFCKSYKILLASLKKTILLQTPWWRANQAEIHYCFISPRGDTPQASFERGFFVIIQ